MRYEEMELDWSMTDGFENCEEEDVLDEKELNKLEFFAEHPELDDPIFWFMQERRRPRRGGDRR